MPALPVRSLEAPKRTVVALCIGAVVRQKEDERLAIKFETFIFDAIPEAKGFFACLVARSEEFAPLKNAEGDNSPRSVVHALEERTRAWFRRAGSPLPEGAEVPEITPLMAYDFESFVEALPDIGKAGGV